MNFSRFSIFNPLPAILFFVVVSLLGIIAYSKIKIQNFPDIDVPTITVSVAVQGASPPQIETEVTRKIEDAVSSIDSIDYIQSSVSQGSSSTTIVFKLEKNSLMALSEVRDSVSSIKSNLPANALDPVIQLVKTTGAPIRSYAVADPSKSDVELSWFIDNDISKRLSNITGVSKITREGGVSREIVIELNDAMLKSLNVTPMQVASQIKVTQIDESGGISKIGGTTQNIRTNSKATSVENVKNLPISINNQSYILADIANVLDSHAEKSQESYNNSTKTIAFQIYKATGSSEVSIAKDVEAELAKLKKEFPTISISQVSDSVGRIQSNFDFSMQSLYEGAILAVIVVWLFLRNIRATFISAVALPLSILPTFAAMHYFMGFTFNGITLLALTLVVGILVDDAIVEVENVDRHLKNGSDPFNAAIEAADEIGTAVIATTFTLVAVFLPTAFMAGIPGKFFHQFGWTIAIAVISSLLVARLLTPMMCAYLLKAPKGHKVDIHDSFMSRNYLKLIKKVLDFPKTTIIIAIAFFAFSVVLARNVPSGFIPPAQTGSINLSVEMAPGTTFKAADATAEMVFNQIKDIHEISSVFRSVGGSAAASSSPGGGSSSAEVRKTSFIITIAPEFKNSQQLVERKIRDKIVNVPGIKYSIGSGGSGEKYQITLAGDDLELLKKAAHAIEAESRKLVGVGSISSSINLNTPELIIHPNMQLIASMGITPLDINNAVRFYTAGDFDNSASKINLPERQVPIKVRKTTDNLTDIEEIRNIGIKSAAGATVYLRDIADVQFDANSYQLTRYDRNKNVSISIELNGKPLGEVAKAVSQFESVKMMPKGVNIVESGEGKRMAELFSSFGSAMLLGLVGILVVLILLFKSVKFPVINLSALPLAVGGALIALFMFNQSFSMPALIGVLMLMGIVTKNSVLLIDYYILAKERGASVYDAIVDACDKRARPIIMTTVAMIAGMLPMALGTSGDPSFRIPMAIVVIGGLLTSTILSLIVIPAILKVCNRF